MQLETIFLGEFVAHGNRLVEKKTARAVRLQRPKRLETSFDLRVFVGRPFWILFLVSKKRKCFFLIRSCVVVERRFVSTPDYSPHLTIFPDPGGACFAYVVKLALAQQLWLEWIASTKYTRWMPTSPAELCSQVAIE